MKLKLVKVAWKSTFQMVCVEALQYKLTRRYPLQMPVGMLMMRCLTDS